MTESEALSLALIEIDHLRELLKEKTAELEKAKAELEAKR
jgi:hypothetical protein